MIRKFSIKAFKSLFNVEFELGKVNVFIGANGSGKSNLLEAIGVLGAAANGQVNDEALLHRGVRPGLPALYKSSFKGFRTRSRIHLEAVSDENISYAVELNNPIKDPKPAWRFMTENVSNDSKKILGRSNRNTQKYHSMRGLAALRAVEWEFTSPESKLIRELSNYCIYSPNTKTLRGLIPDLQQREPVGLAGGRLPEAAHELLHGQNQEHRITKIASQVRELIDWATSYGSRFVGKNIPLSPSVASTQRVLYFKDRFMREQRNGLTGYDASEGALYVIFAAALAVLPNAPSILAIDNIDQALNPRLARRLMSHLCTWILNDPNEKQLILTTHNPLVLDGLPLDNDEIRLFTVDRSRKGHSVIDRVHVDTKSLFREDELWTISRLWVNGHLGGMPDV